MEESLHCKEEEEEDVCSLGSCSSLTNPDHLVNELVSDLKDGMAGIQSVEEEIRRNQDSIAKSEESVKMLQSTMQSLMEQTALRKAELASRSERLRALKHDIKEISLEDIAKEEEELKKLMEDNLVIQSQLTLDEATRSRKDELKDQVNAYKEYLGLRVSGSAEEVQFTFTKIDKESPESTYMVGLTVTDNVYKCCGCEPPIHDIQNLFNELNVENDFQNFLIQLRERFVMLANKENCQS